MGRKTAAGAALVLAGTALLAPAYMAEELYLSAALVALAVLVAISGALLLTRRDGQREKEMEAYTRGTGSEARICPRCSNEVIGMGKFCGHCGEPLEGI